MFSSVRIKVVVGTGSITVKLIVAPATTSTEYAPAEKTAHTVALQEKCERKISGRPQINLILILPEY